MGNEGSRPADPAVQAQADARTIRRMDKVIRKKVRGGLTYNMKLLIRGERGTGKSSLMARLQGQPIPQTHEPTREIQTASIQWTMATHEDMVKCELWDVVDVGIPPDEPLEAPTPDSVGRHPVALVDAQNVDVYQNAHCVIFLMDITKYSTLEYVRAQLDHVPVHIPTLVLGTFRDLRKDDVPLKRAIFKEDVQTLLYGDHKDHKLPGFRRPLEQHYFEASLSNCYGLKALHTYLGVPFLHLKVATVKQQLRLLETELASTKAQVDVSIASQKYSDFVANLSGADVKTGLRTAQPPAPAVAEPLKGDELEDLPERDGGVDGAASPLPLKIVHQVVAPPPAPPTPPVPTVVVAKQVPKASADAPRTSWSKNETLEDFQVKTDMDRFYSSDDDSGAGTDEDVVVPAAAASRVYRKQDFLYSDSEDEDDNVYTRPKVPATTATKAAKALSAKAVPEKPVKAVSLKAASPKPTKAASPKPTKAASPKKAVSAQALKRTPMSPKTVPAEAEPAEAASTAVSSPKLAVGLKKPTVVDSDSDEAAVPADVPAYISLPPRKASAVGEPETVADDEAPGVSNDASASEEEPWATNSIEFSDDSADEAPRGPTTADLPTPDVGEGPSQPPAPNDDDDFVPLPVRSVALSDSDEEPSIPNRPIIFSDSEEEQAAPLPTRPVILSDSEEGAAPSSKAGRPVVLLSDEDDKDDAAKPQPVVVYESDEDVVVPTPHRPVVASDSDDDELPVPSRPVVLDDSDDDTPSLPPTSAANPLGLPSLPVTNVLTSAPSPLVMAKAVPKAGTKAAGKSRRKMMVVASSDDDTDSPAPAPALPAARRRAPSSDGDGDFKVETSKSAFWNDDDDDDDEVKEIPVARPSRRARQAMPALPTAFSVAPVAAPAPAPVQMNSSVLAAIEEAKRAALAMLDEAPAPRAVAEEPLAAKAGKSKAKAKSKKSGDKPKKPKKAKQPMVVLDSD
ncbi:GTP-binding protein Parf [Achlya hypogyna]|uniref:GTP-binding protein Parf n=1 Tax=Achlya hypogyna TaxID=1202772 RepID=A0A1V9YES3_ACHHY|nr:GTP-binding protein Parf [Achlya hypogyna]